MQRSGSNEVVVDEAFDGPTQVLRIRLNEERPVDGGQERWATTAHWMTHNGSGWVWVDVEWVSDAMFARPPDMAAPILVRTLLKQRVAGSDRGRLGPTPLVVGTGDVEVLLNWIFHPERLVPIVVYSVDQHILPDAYSARVRTAARRLAGCADIRMLTTDSQPAFNDVMDPLSLSVFQGAVRVYLPGIDKDDPRPWRHRYTRARNLSADPHKAANVVVRQVLPRMASQRPPEIYRQRIRHLLNRQRHDWEKLAEELDVELRQVQREKEDLQLERDIALDEATLSERQAVRVRRRLDQLRNYVRELKGAPEAIENAVDDEIDPKSCAEAIILADSLEHICIHPNAPQDVARMDESADAGLWAQRILRHLQALDAYAKEKHDGFSGSFWEWCENSGSDYALSTKFVAMTESERVRTNERFRSCRVLPVDQLVAASGEIEMFAHLKTVQGGGTTIPRVYFHDDTMGVTKKAHIGFIGPHDLMPNESTN